MSCDACPRQELCTTMGFWLLQLLAQSLHIYFLQGLPVLILLILLFPYPTREGGGDRPGLGAMSFFSCFAMRQAVTGRQDGFTISIGR